MIWYHKGSPPVLFWDEKRPWLGRGGLLCGNSVPKFVLYFCPDHWGGPVGPKLHEPSSYTFQTWFESKKSHFRTFTPLTPSGNPWPLFVKSPSRRPLLLRLTTVPEGTGISKAGVDTFCMSLHFIYNNTHNRSFGTHSYACPCIVYTTKHTHNRSFGTHNYACPCIVHNNTRNQSLGTHKTAIKGSSHVTAAFVQCKCKSTHAHMHMTHRNAHI
jgi:hypothetical protein